MLIGKKKFKFFHQLENVDCGPACLAMVSSFHGIKISVKEIKKICDVTRTGVTVRDLIFGARQIGLESAGVKMTMEELPTAPLPLILYWKQSHFVVLHKIVERKHSSTFYIADPGYGKVKLDGDTVKKEWMGANQKGVAILVNLREGTSPAGTREKETRFYKEEFVKYLFKFMSLHKWKYFLSLGLMLIGLITNWAIPLVFQKTIDNGIGTKSLEIVWMLLLAQLGLFLGNFISQIWSDFILTRLNFKLSINLKESFLYKVMKLPIKYFDTRLNASILQRLNDQDKIRTFVTWKLSEMVLNILNIIAFSVILYHINKYIFYIFFSLSLISILWMLFFLKQRRILGYSIILRQTENSNSVYEFVMNMPEIKINSAQTIMITRLAEIQKKLNNLELRSLFLNLYQNFGANFLSKLKELLSIAACAFLIVNEQLTMGSLLSITYIIGQLNYPLKSLLTYFRETQDADIARKRINDVYLEKEENDGLDILPPSGITDINLENVAFKYPGSFSPTVLNNISFIIPKNKITAIVGVSGSGKTTLLKLLLSYYNPTQGQIMIGETDMSQVNSDQWRKRCGTVLQDGHIFPGTIAENIAIADDEYDREMVMNAAKIACIHEFITRLPMGYNTKIGSVGMQLSGGQTQRILIARAVYKNPDYLFFDEATSSLDAKTEKLIMNNLTNFFRGKTVVIIAHRLSTVKNADQILVMDKGSVVEKGRHQELVENKRDYFELVRNQLELGT